jgi:hypothetical protein
VYIVVFKYVPCIRSLYPRKGLLTYESVTHVVCNLCIWRAFAKTNKYEEKSSPYKVLHSIYVFFHTSFKLSDIFIYKIMHFLTTFILSFCLCYVAIMTLLQFFISLFLILHSYLMFYNTYSWKFMILRILTPLLYLTQLLKSFKLH